MISTASMSERGRVHSERDSCPQNKHNCLNTDNKQHAASLGHSVDLWTPPWQESELLLNCFFSFSTYCASQVVRAWSDLSFKRSHVKISCWMMRQWEELRVYRMKLLQADRTKNETRHRGPSAYISVCAWCFFCHINHQREKHFQASFIKITLYVCRW